MTASATQGAWECRHGIDGRDWCDECHAPPAPAWDRFHKMSEQVHEVLIGAAQCRNHLTVALECWDECDDAERKQNIEDALLRLTRVGI